MIFEVFFYPEDAQRPDWPRLWCTGLPLEFSNFQGALSLLFGFSPRSLCSSPRLSCTAGRAPHCWRRSSLTSSWRLEAKRAATRRSRSAPRRRKTHLCCATSNTRSVSNLLSYIYPDATLPQTPGQYLTHYPIYTQMLCYLKHQVSI